MNTFTIKLNKPIGYGNGTNQSKKKKSEAMGNLSSKAQEDTNVKSKTAIDASSKIVAEQESQVPDESSQQVECATLGVDWFDSMIHSCCVRHDIDSWPKAH